jgi:hypothetical protein
MPGDAAHTRLALPPRARHGGADLRGAGAGGVDVEAHVVPVEHERVEVQPVHRRGPRPALRGLAARAPRGGQALREVGAQQDRVLREGHQAVPEPLAKLPRARRRAAYRAPRARFWRVWARSRVCRGRMGARGSGGWCGGGTSLKSERDCWRFSAEADCVGEIK